MLLRQADDPAEAMRPVLDPRSCTESDASHHHVVSLRRSLSACWNSADSAGLKSGIGGVFLAASSSA